MTKAQMARLLSDQGMYEEAMALESKYWRTSKNAATPPPTVGLAVCLIFIGVASVPSSVGAAQEALAIFRSRLNRTTDVSGKSTAIWGVLPRAAQRPCMPAAAQASSSVAQAKSQSR